MAANPFTRGTCPGRARPPHRASFEMGHAKGGGRKKCTPNAISPRTRKAIAAAAKRIARGSNLNRHHWQRVIDNYPLITEALEHQGKLFAPREAVNPGDGMDAWLRRARPRCLLRLPSRTPGLTGDEAVTAGKPYVSTPQTFRDNVVM